MNLSEYSIQIFLLIKNEISKGNRCTMTVASRSMSPLIKKSSKVKIKKCTLDELFFGDICVYEKGLDFVAHRYLYNKRLNGIRYFLCKGDANIWPDKWISEKRLIGKISNIENDGIKINLDAPLGNIKSNTLFLFSFFCNLLKFLLCTLKKGLIRIVVYLSRFRVFRAGFDLIYKIASQIVILTLRRNKNISSISLRGSLVSNLWMPGLSDIDFVIRIDHIDDKIIMKINEDYLFLKKFIPFLGEASIYEKRYRVQDVYDKNEKTIYLDKKYKPGKQHIKNNDSDILFEAISKILYLHTRLVHNISIFSSEPEGDLKAFRGTLLCFRKIYAITIRDGNKEFNRCFDIANKHLRPLMDTVTAKSIYEYRNSYIILSEIYKGCLSYLEELTEKLKENLGKEFEDIIYVISNSLRYYDMNEFALNMEFDYLKINKLLIKTLVSQAEIYFKCNNIKENQNKLKENLISFLKTLNGRGYFLYTENSIIMKLITSPESPFDMFRFCQCQDRAILEGKLKNNRLWERIQRELFKNAISYMQARLSNFPSISQPNLDSLLEDIYINILSLKLYREIGFIPFSFREALDSVISNYKGTNFAKELSNRFKEDIFDSKSRQEVLGVYFKNYLFMHNLLCDEKRAIAGMTN